MVKVYFAGDFPQKNGMELDVLNVWKKNFQQKNGMELDVLNVWKKLDDLISFYYTMFSMNMLYRDFPG